MKYKLINQKTKEEHLCNKVTIDGFDYYVNEEAKIEADNLWVVSIRTNYLGKTFYPKNDGTVTDDVIKNLLLSVKYDGHYETTVGSGTDCDLIIATNHSNIDIPKVKEMSDYLAKQLNKQSFDDYGYPKWDEGKLFHRQMGFIDGYNKSQETHPFSEEDMIEFILWKDENKFSIISTKEDWVSELLEYSGCVYTSKELLQLWKSQQPKIIYYE